MHRLVFRWIDAGALVVAAALAAFLLASKASAAQEKFPVWWSPEFGVDSRAEIERRLSEPLPPELQITLGRRSYEVNPHEQGPVTTCNDYIRFRADGFVARSVETATAAYALRRRCYPLSALLRAEPARTSHVRSFKMTDDAFDYLPPLLAGFCNFVPRFLEANRSGVPWSQFDFKEPYPAETKAFARDDKTFVEQSFLDGELWTEDVFSIIGRGDFDGDGQDDLLVKRELVQIVTDPLLRLGTGLDSLLLLTRRTSDGVLRATESFSPFGSVGRACFVDPERLRHRQ